MIVDRFLPVIRGGSKKGELKYCIKNAFFWEGLHKYELVQNVRLKTGDKKKKKEFCRKVVTDWDGYR